MASRIPISLLPERFRGGAASAGQDNPPGPPSWVNRQITGLLQSLSRVSCLHPIQTVVVVALLASTSYVGPLKESLSGEGGLLASSSSSGGGPAVAADDWASLAEGSRTIFAGPESGWKWQAVEAEYSAAAKTATTTASAAGAAARDDVDHLSLLTLVFPDPDSSSSADAGADPNSAAPSRNMPLATNLTATARPLPATRFSPDRTLAYAVPHHEAVGFLTAVREFSDGTEPEAPAKDREGEPEAPVERRMWIMRAAARPGSPRTAVAQWFRSGWTGLLGLLRRAEVIDILIMALGYVAMHLTFASLFVSMRRMGSNFWLAASVLFSSTFAFLFGLVVTTQLGVPVSVVLLSEGLPFLVVTVGFEKNIVLTRAVLSHAVEHPGRSGGAGSGGGRGSRGASPIQNAVRAAIREKGYQIVRDYAIEIAVLILGAASGVQGGLQQFCFLAGWILVFDGILLFTFFTAILSIKLEINRMRRHVDLRRALEDDGVSGRLAEKVARSGDRSSPLGSGSTAAASILFGGGGGVPKFKVLMVSGFVLVNAVNLCIIPFRGGDYYSSFSSLARGLGGGLIFSSRPGVDPFQVASAGLDVILAAARASGRPTLVTVLAPIRYQLEYPSVHYGYSLGSGLAGGPWAGPSGSGWPASSAQAGSASPMGGYYAMGGRMVGSLFDSLEDPILSKWIIVALAMSVALNGYLFNAARWGIKDPNLPDHEIDRADLASAERFNDAGVPTPALNGGFGGAAAAAAAGSVNPPPTPSPTDDEGERGPAAAPGPAKLQRPANLAMTMTKLKTAATGSAAGSAAAAPGAGSEPNRADDVLKLMIREKRVGEMTDEEVIAMSLCGEIQGYALEKNLGDFTRAVRLRRAIISRTRATAGLTDSLDQSGLPYKDYNWERVFGACCENVIGYMPMPVGVAGPIVIDGQSYFVPMATTEGVLVASTSRGSKAINAGGGAVTVLTHDGMTRGPVVGFDCLERAGAAKHWLDSDAGRAMMTRAFDSTSNYARLREMKATLAGTYLFIRFKTTTGDAMGMNMISKGVEHALNVMMSDGGFEDMNIISISGNYCADKKPAALNWIDGRGKGVVAEAIIPADAIRRVLKTDVDTLVDLNTAKNYIGSAMAGAIGGFNAHAANMVAAIFIATGQDPAQVVESCSCITIMKNVRGSLQISVTMPSLEVGTLGGGTILEPQAAMLEMLGVRGPHPTSPGENARRLARIIAAVTMAGELSLCGAQAAGHLVRAHMAHNRSAPPTRATTPPAGSVVGNGVATPVGLTMTSTLGKGK